MYSPVGKQILTIPLTYQLDPVTCTSIELPFLFPWGISVSMETEDAMNGSDLSWLTVEIELNFEFGVIIGTALDKLPLVSVVDTVMLNNIILSVMGFDDAETSKMYTHDYHGYTYKVDMTVSLRLPKYALK